MIFLTDAAGRNVYSSPEWEAFTGQSVEAGRGSGWSSQVHPDDGLMVQGAVLDAIRSHEPFTTDHRINKVGHGWVWVVGCGMPAFCQHGGAFIGFVGSITEAEDQRERSASFKIGQFRPPPPHPSTLPSSPLDLAIDHLLIARSLVPEDATALQAIDLGLYLLGSKRRSRH